MNGPLLVLDPGHGGSQPAGASTPNRGSGGGLLEKDVALDVARRTRDRLTSDHVVVLTRDSDSNLSLAERASTAKRLGAAAFVSVHLSGSDPAADRCDVVVAKAASSSSRLLADVIRRKVGEATGAPGEVLEADLGQIAAERHDPGTAACLVEVASLAPPARAALLADPAYLDKIADAIAAGIREAVGGPTPASLGRRQWVGAQGYDGYAGSTALIEPNIDYRTSSLADTIAIWADLLSRYAEWATGVPNSALTAFPHAAICQLRLHNAAGRTAWGTGFYIADEVLLTCGHNFLNANGWVTTSVDVQPAYSPTASILPSKTFTVDHTQLVHPKWLSSGGHAHTHDLAVLPVPGLPATAGVFNLANVSLAQDQGIVVCGYGKVGDDNFDGQGQRMDGAHISDSDFELVYYPIHTIGGHSGSPVFHHDMVIGVHTGPRGNGEWVHENRAVLLTPEKEDWIVSKAGSGVRFGHAASARSASWYRGLTDENSTQAEQSDQVRLDVARSVGPAEGRYDSVHDDSQRVNFGVGSWTGVRIAAVLDTYAAFAAESGLTDRMVAHFGGQAGFDAVRDAFRQNDTATVLTAAQRTQLAALGADTQLQGAQDRHLAEDIRADLADIGNRAPWYPFIDGGMGAISEIAAHVLVHAMHQSGSAGLRKRFAEVIDGFGGPAAFDQAMAAGTITERQFLEALAERVVANSYNRETDPAKKARLKESVRQRYVRLWTNWGASRLSYYFNPA